MGPSEPFRDRTSPGLRSLVSGRLQTRRAPSAKQPIVSNRKRCLVSSSRSGHCHRGPVRTSGHGSRTDRSITGLVKSGGKHDRFNCYCLFLSLSLLSLSLSVEPKTDLRHTRVSGLVRPSDQTTRHRHTLFILILGESTVQKRYSSGVLSQKHHLVQIQRTSKPSFLRRPNKAPRSPGGRPFSRHSRPPKWTPITRLYHSPEHPTQPCWSSSPGGVFCAVFDGRSGNGGSPAATMTRDHHAQRSPDLRVPDLAKSPDLPSSFSLLLLLI